MTSWGRKKPLELSTQGIIISSSSVFFPSSSLHLLSLSIIFQSSFLLRLCTRLLFISEKMVKRVSACVLTSKYGEWRSDWHETIVAVTLQVVIKGYLSMQTHFLCYRLVYNNLFQLFSTVSKLNCFNHYYSQRWEVRVIV